ncbi:MAG: hypothetical protein IPL70_17420 [Uliginosibacterium sp.]|nr:hypothetical protein [Uliginosibacterium sp.]
MTPQDEHILRALVTRSGLALGIDCNAIRYRNILVAHCQTSPSNNGAGEIHPAQSHTPNLTVLGGQPLTGTSSVPVAGRSPSSSYRHDSNFDGQLVSAVQTGSTLPLNTELHVIGVYEASDSTKGADKQKCMVFREDPQALFECHAQVNHRMNPIAVNVPSSANPIALVLMAYEPVQWRITSSATSNIQKVIISGYHGQDVEGLALTIPVVSYTHEISSCKTCQRQARYFYAYDENSKEFPTAIKKITAITGLTLNSFQEAIKESGSTSVRVPPTLSPANSPN